MVRIMYHHCSFNRLCLFREEMTIGAITEVTDYFRNTLYFACFGTKLWSISLQHIFKTQCPYTISKSLIRKWSHSTCCYCVCCLVFWYFLLISIHFKYYQIYVEFLQLTYVDMYFVDSILLLWELGTLLYNACIYIYIYIAYTHHTLVGK